MRSINTAVESSGVPSAGVVDALAALIEHGGFPEPILAGSARGLRLWQKERLDRFFLAGWYDRTARSATIALMYPPGGSTAHLLVLARLGANQTRSAGL
jgi:hypothetical protein